MNRSRKPVREKGYLDIIDEASHLLRRVPAGVISCYYIGSVPFVLGFLYFWSDMSRSAFAYQHAAEASCSLSLLFIWMKCWQAVFCRHLRASISGSHVQRRPLMDIIQLAVSQTVLQASGFIILPLAFLSALPFGWAYAFYQNVSVYGYSKPDTLRDVYNRSLQQAMAAPGQNHVILFIVSVFGFFVFLNVWLFMYQLPHAVKMITGTETLFTKSGWIMLFNTTYLAVSCGITYLLVDPLIKAGYTLRCFYGESVRTGEDLNVELSRFRSQPKVLAVLIALFCIVGPAFHICSADSRGAAVSLSHKHGPISPRNIDRSIDEIIIKREFSWRMPRESAHTDEENGLIASFIKSITDTVKAWAAPVWEWLKSALEWIIDKLTPDVKSKPSIDGSQMHLIRVLMYVLIALVSCLLLLQVQRIWKRRKLREAERTVDAAPQKPDIKNEETRADELPADGWLDLARDLIAQGDLRLALRALYLACLSHLARQRLITISNAKSNSEYKHELFRNAHAMPEVLSSFSENILLFDRSWYGMHEVTADVLSVFQKNREQIMVRREK